MDLAFATPEDPGRPKRASFLIPGWYGLGDPGDVVPAEERAASIEFSVRQYDAAPDKSSNPSTHVVGKAQDPDNS